MSFEPVRVGDYLIRLGSGIDVPRVEGLWCELYDHQRRNGMIIELPNDAFQQWAGSIGPILGRFACLFVAEKRDEVVGFLAGRIRSLPPYFGGRQAGFISDVYVAEAHRSQGLGRKLVTFATDWFTALGLTRIELQVIINNTPARKLYRELGWTEELVQMVWQAE